MGKEIWPSPNGIINTQTHLIDRYCVEAGNEKLIKPLLLLFLSQCDIGEQCAVRKGARIGKMCDCPRGAFCNFFLLKCL